MLLPQPHRIETNMSFWELKVKTKMKIFCENDEFLFDKERKQNTVQIISNDSTVVASSSKLWRHTSRSCPFPALTLLVWCDKGEERTKPAIFLLNFKGPIEQKVKKLVLKLYNVKTSSWCR